MDVEIMELDRTHPAALWREAILDQKLSQVTVAEAVGVSTKHLSQIINGHVLPSVQLVIRLADYLNLPVRTMWNIQARWVLDEALGDRAAVE